MSSRVPRTTVRRVMLTLIVTALPSGVYAANPGRPLKAEKSQVQATPLPPDRPESPTARGLGSFTRQTPLGEAIGILRDSTTPPLKIIAL
jgi:hypothetical protein